MDGPSLHSVGVSLVSSLEAGFDCGEITIDGDCLFFAELFAAARPNFKLVPGD